MDSVTPETNNVNLEVAKKSPLQALKDFSGSFTRGQKITVAASAAAGITTGVVIGRITSGAVAPETMAEAVEIVTDIAEEAITE